MVKVYDVVIIGGGAAGLSAAIYSARYLMKTLIITGKEPGGETATAWLIENYPGFKKIDGFELIQNMIDQAKAAGVEFVYESVTKLEKDRHCFTTHTKRDVFQSRQLILAYGSQRRHLGLPQEKEFTGKGVSYCSTCDAPLYKDKDIAIIGGGDSSVKGAILATNYSSKVYLITRNDKLTPEPVNLDRMKKLGKQIEIIYKNQIQKFSIKNNQLVGIKLENEYHGSKILKVQGVLIEIGFQPDTVLASMLGVKLDQQGYIDVDRQMRTNLDGVFACGDSSNAFGSFKQVITAAASGALAATSAYQDLGVHQGIACDIHALPPMVIDNQALALVTNVKSKRH